MPGSLTLSFSPCPYLHVDRAPSDTELFPYAPIHEPHILRLHLARREQHEGLGAGVRLCIEQNPRTSVEFDARRLFRSLL